MADCCEKVNGRANGRFLAFPQLSSNSVTTHVGKAVESGGLRTEGLVLVQFYCKNAKDASEGRSKLYGRVRKGIQRQTVSSDLSEPKTDTSLENRT